MISQTTSIISTNKSKTFISANNTGCLTDSLFGVKILILVPSFTSSFLSPSSGGVGAISGYFLSLFSKNHTS